MHSANLETMRLFNRLKCSGVRCVHCHPISKYIFISDIQALGRSGLSQFSVPHDVKKLKINIVSKLNQKPLRETSERSSSVKSVWLVWCEQSLMGTKACSMEWKTGGVIDHESCDDQDLTSA